MTEDREQMLEETKSIAMLMTWYVREHLTDEQIRELDPILLNAVYTMLYAIRNYGLAPTSTKLMNEKSKQLRNRWEEPKLTEDFLLLNPVFRECRENMTKKGKMTKETDLPDKSACQVDRSQSTSRSIAVRSSHASGDIGVIDGSDDEAEGEF